MQYTRLVCLDSDKIKTYLKQLGNDRLPSEILNQPLDLSKEFRSKDYPLIHLLLQNPLQELISTVVPCPTNPGYPRPEAGEKVPGYLYLFDGCVPIDSRRSDDIQWNDCKKMSVKLIVYNDNTSMYKLKNNKNDEGVVVMRRQTWRAEGKDRGWRRNEYKLVVKETYFKQTQDGRLSVTEGQSLQDFPVLVHYFWKKEANYSNQRKKRKRSAFGPEESLSPTAVSPADSASSTATTAAAAAASSSSSRLRSQAAKVPRVGHQASGVGRSLMATDNDRDDGGEEEEEDEGDDGEEEDGNKKDRHHPHPRYGADRNGDFRSRERKRSRQPQRRYGGSDAESDPHYLENEEDRSDGEAAEPASGEVNGDQEGVEEGDAHHPRAATSATRSRSKRSRLSSQYDDDNNMHGDDKYDNRYPLYDKGSDGSGLFADVARGEEEEEEEEEQSDYTANATARRMMLRQRQPAAGIGRGRGRGRERGGGPSSRPSALSMPSDRYSSGEDNDDSDRGTLATDELIADNNSDNNDGTMVAMVRHNGEEGIDGQSSSFDYSSMEQGPYTLSLHSGREEEEEEAGNDVGLSVDQSSSSFDVDSMLINSPPLSRSFSSFAIDSPSKGFPRTSSAHLLSRSREGTKLNVSRGGGNAQFSAGFSSPPLSSPPSLPHQADVSSPNFLSIKDEPEELSPLSENEVLRFTSRIENGSIVPYTPVGIAAVNSGQRTLAEIKSYAPQAGPAVDHTKVIVVCDGFTLSPEKSYRFTCTFEGSVAHANQIAPCVLECYAPPHKPGIAYFWVSCEEEQQQGENAHQEQQQQPQREEAEEGEGARSGEASDPPTNSKEPVQVSKPVPFYYTPVDTGRLSLAWELIGHSNINSLMRNFKYTVKELDLSNNNLMNVDFLDGFRELHTLILDNNHVTQSARFPLLPKLHTLCINHNWIIEIDKFLDNLVENVPSLRYLSTLHNPACPFFSNAKHHYYNYRIYILSRLRNLTHLDSSPVTMEEWRHAACIITSENIPQRDDSDSGAPTDVDEFTNF